jgi:hypothetical protein
MEPINHLKEAIKAFENFTPSEKTINADRVLVKQYVKFPMNCRDEAMETLTVEAIVREMTDLNYNYLQLVDVVDGPFKDGNRIQIVNDCKIETVTTLEPYIDGVTNVINYDPAAKHYKEVPKTVSLHEVKGIPENPKVEVGCHSDGGSAYLLFVIALIAAMLRKRTKVFLTVLFLIFLNSNVFAQEWRAPIFNLNFENYVNIKPIQEGMDDNGNIYINYPSVCINESIDTYSKLRSYLEKYSSSREFYPIMENKCHQIKFDKLSESNFTFQTKHFPKDTVFKLEIFYFSDQLAEHLNTQSNMFTAGTSKLLAESTYQSFNNYSDNMLYLADQIGLRAKLSHIYPIGINRFYMENVKENYEIAKLKVLETDKSININVETGEIRGSDYYGSNLNELNVKHFRQPVIASSKFGFLNTVFLARLLLSSKEVFRICSNFAMEYNNIESSITENDIYTEALKKMGDETSPDVYSTIITYYYKSQQDIDSAINYIQDNFEGSIEGRDLLIEGLKGVSLLQGNFCLKSLTLDQLRSDQAGSLAKINECYQRQEITDVQKLILEQLMSMGSHRYVISESFESKLKSLASLEAKKRKTSLDIKSKIRTFYHQQISHPQLQESCRAGMGNDGFEQIIGSN